MTIRNRDVVLCHNKPEQLKQVNRICKVTQSQTENNLGTSERKQYSVRRSTVPLGPENYSLDSHIPYFGSNCSISWEGLDEFMENFVFSLLKKRNNKSE